MRARVPALLIALLASGTAAAGVTCTGTPWGLVCATDSDANGVPERVTLYPSTSPPVLAFDVEHRAGFTGASARSGAHDVRYASHDSDADGRHERREARAEAWGPSRVGVVAAAWLIDRNDSGTPDGAEAFAWSSHWGEARERVGIPLP